MRKIREVIRLWHGQKASGREIALSVGIARSTVGEFVHRSDAAGLSWPLPEHLSDEDLERLLFPRAPAKGEPPRPMPHWPAVQRELSRKGVTLLLLWREYKGAFPEGYGYSRYASLYRAWKDETDLRMRQRHNAGEKLFVDFAGLTMPLTDPTTGAVRNVQVFASAMGASQRIFARAYDSQSLESWLTANADALEFYGAVPRVLVPDNLKSGVASADRFEPAVNPAFRWVGALGYRHTGRSRSEDYVRSRHYDQKGGRWSSVDPLWPLIDAYTYSSNTPSYRVDPSGKLWHPLTVDALQAILRSRGDFLYWWPPHYGSVFDDCFQSATGLRHNSSRFPSTWRDLNFSVPTVVPDYVLPLITFGWGTYKESVFIEAKAVRGSIYLRRQEGQAGAMVDYLSFDSDIAKKKGRAYWTIRPELHYVTTWDTVIGWNLIRAAYVPGSLGVPPFNRKPVALTQTRAEYECRKHGFFTVYAVRFHDWSVPGPAQTVLSATYPPFWVMSGLECYL